MCPFIKNIFNQFIFWGVALLHIHLLFFRPSSSAKASKVPTRCPFKMATQIFQQPTALIANSLLGANIKNNKFSTVSVTKRNAWRRYRHNIYHSSNVCHAQPHVHLAQNDAYIPSFNDIHIEKSSKSMDTFTPPSSSSASALLVSGSPLVVNKNSLQENSKPKGSSALEVVVIGLSHHNAKVDVREKLAIPEDRWNEVSSELTTYGSISEASVLSTCNRFELYLSGPNQYQVIRDALDFLTKRAEGLIDQATLRSSLFMLSGEDAIWHLLRVSAGLDSIVLGEGQILAQVKKSFEHGVEESNPAGKIISKMLNLAVTAGKRARSETNISKGAISISSAAVEFTLSTLKQECPQLESLNQGNIVILGAGKMVRLLLSHMQSHGVKKVKIVNRSMDKIHEIQKDYPDLEVEGYLYDKMIDVLADADVVYPSTAASEPILTNMEFEQIFSRRDLSLHPGFHIVDIAVPRNVHAECYNYRPDSLFCYNVDDLKNIVHMNTMKRKKEIYEVEMILKEELMKFRSWQQSLHAIPTIHRLQEKAETMRKEEIEKASKKLTSLSTKDFEMVERITKGIVAKLLHGPMTHLKQQKECDDTLNAIKQVQQAFQLEH